jgi:transcriptional/translational regulatory protein YebC/TACO1
MKLMDALDDNDDVQQTNANFELPEELLAEMG